MDFITINKHRLNNMHEVWAMISGLSLLHSDLQHLEAGAASSATPLDNTTVTLAFNTIFSPKGKHINLVYGQLPSCEEVCKVIKTMFPSAVIQHSVTFSEVDKVGLHHVTVRCNYMQPEKLKGFPVMSGSAMCSCAPVAFMQAFVRMVITELVGYQAGNFAKALAAETHPTHQTAAKLIRF